MRRPVTGKGSFKREGVVRDWLLSNGFVLDQRVVNRLGYTYYCINQHGDKAKVRYGKTQFDFQFKKA